MAKSANGSNNPPAFNLGDIVKELFTFREEPGAKPAPLWAFITAIACNVVAWIIYRIVGYGIINLLPMIICAGAVFVAIMFIRPAKGLWKYLTLISLADFVIMSIVGLAGLFVIY
jgi:hypothetical protein